MIARVAEEAFDALKAMPARVGAKDTPMPYAALERAVLPQVEDVVAGVNAVLDRAPVEARGS